MQGAPGGRGAIWIARGDIGSKAGIPFIDGLGVAGTVRPVLIEGRAGLVQLLPDKAKSGLEMCNALRSSLKAAKSGFDKLTDTQRTIFCKGTIGQLRDAWEQAISDYIRPVLERFDNKVKPTSMFKLGILTEDDVMRVMTAQSKLSEDLHSSAQALNPEAVSLDDLLNEIKTLEEWIQSIRDRQKNAIKPALT